MTIDTIIRTISLILAPTVMITSCMLFLNGLFARYEHITARMRAMHRERLDLFQTVGPADISTAEMLSIVRKGRARASAARVPDKRVQPASGRPRSSSKASPRRRRR